MRKEIIQHSRILIVDDQPANVALVDRVLRQSGYSHISSLSDSRHIIDRLRAFQPDLVVLDLMMPHVDGYSVMTQLRGWTPDEAYLPVLVMTADVSKAARQKALSLGAKDFLTKPIDTSEATLRIYNLLETRWLYRHLHSKIELLLAQVSESRQPIADAGEELERLIDGGVPPGQVAPARGCILRASAAIGRIAETVRTFDFDSMQKFSAGEPAPGFAARLSAGSES